MGLQRKVYALRASGELHSSYPTERLAVAAARVLLPKYPNVKFTVVTLVELEEVEVH